MSDLPRHESAPSPASPTSERLLTPRFVRILLAQTTFGFGWSLYLLAPKFFATELSADARTIGYLSAMGGLFSIATIPLAARGIDRIGRRAFFGIGCASLLFASLGFMAVDRMGPAVFVLNGLIGASFVLAFNAGATLATDEAPRAKLGQAIGAFGASNMIMNGISTVVGEKLAAAAGWNTVFALGAIAAVAAIAMSFGVRELPVSLARRAPEAPGQPSMTSLSPLLASSTLIGASFSAMFVFSQPYALSLGMHEVNDFFIGFTSTAVITRVAFGNLGDRFGRTRVSICAALLYAISAASMIGLRPHLLLAHGALFGLAHGVLYPTLNAVLMERVGLAARGRAMTLYTGAFNVGTTASGLAWGSLAQSRGYPSIYAGAATLALLAAACLLAPARGPEVALRTPPA